MKFAGSSEVNGVTRIHQTSAGVALALAAWAFAFLLSYAGPARGAGCDAKTAQAASHAQAIGEKFSGIASMCGTDSATLMSGPPVRQVARQEDHAEHLSMYDSADIFLSDDEPDPFLLARERGGMPPALRGSSGARAVALMPQFQAASRASGIDHLLLHAIAHVESRHNPAAVSPAGAIGLMQIMPATARRFGVVRPHVELRDPATSLQVSAAYLKVLQRRFDNNLTLTLAAYNAGEGAVEKYGRRVPPYPETRHYVTDVMAMYRSLRAAASPERVAALFVGK
jgi:hypothetical protein